MSSTIVTDGCYEILDAWVNAMNSFVGTLTMGLFNAAHTPAPADTLATYAAIESSFPGYVRTAIPVMNNPTPDGFGGVLSQSFTPVHFAVSGANAEFCYGYFIFNNTSGLLVGAEEFAAPGPYDMSSNGTTLDVTLQVQEDPA